ncbi:MAG: hypothetical protein JWP00_672 [Chloroflexi bacterium]|jgi:hypothetical protein|nr:hypothetical protein [Chloroflexota bacterium]
MAETALCRYPCPNCNTDLEQEGYMIIETHDEAPTRQLLNDEINMAQCHECNHTSRLNIPLLYHDSHQELFIIYVPELAHLGPEQLADTIRYPYGQLVTQEAERRGIELPEPDAAAFPEGQEELRTQPGAKFHALTQEQAGNLLPEYLLRPTIVDTFEVLRTAVQAALDGMTGQEVVDDMVRLQLINNIISAEDPIARRKVMHHAEPYLTDELYEVIDTLGDQMRSEGQNELVEKLQWVKDQIEKYKSAQKQRLAKSKNKPANE